MFHILHRIYVLLWSLLLIASAAWVYANSGISEGLSDWYTVWQNKPRPATPAAELTGVVTKVVNGSTVTVRGVDRTIYNIGLLGAVPATNAGPHSRSFKDPAKAKLTDLVLSNEVQLVLTWVDQSRRGVGVVHLGSTNINALMIESGLMKLNREFIKPLPLLEQYALIRAERKSNERTLAAAGTE